MRRLALLPLVVCLFSLPSVAGAEEAPVEAAEVRLKNGESVRGSLVNVEPGQRVIVIIAGKESVIPWGDIAQIVDGSGGSTVVEAPAPPAAPKKAEPVAEAPETPRRGMPMLHVESDYPGLELERVDGDVGPGINVANPYSPTSITKYICRAPCDRLVDGRDGNRFFFAAPGMIPSRHFRLDEANGVITARVHGASAARFAGGLIMSMMGGAMALGGSMLLTFGLVVGSQPQPALKEKQQEPGSPAPERFMLGFGLGTLAVGTGLIVGGVLLLKGGTTKIEFVAPDGKSPGVYFADGALRF